MTDPAERSLTESPAPKQKEKISFSSIHIKLQAALAVLFFFAGELDRTLGLWILIIPVVFIPAITVALIWIVSVFSNLIRRRWTRLISAAIAPLIVWPVFFLLLMSGFDADWVHFQIKRPSYMATIRTLDVSHPRERSWDWGGRGGVGSVNFHYSVVYDETDRTASRDGEKVEGGGTVWVRSFGDHFYLVTYVVQ